MRRSHLSAVDGRKITEHVNNRRVARSPLRRGRQRTRYPLLDLHATFADHDARNQQRFEFAYGWHWNVLANRLVGEAIPRVLLRDPGLGAGSVQRGADAGRPPQG